MGRTKRDDAGSVGAALRRIVAAAARLKEWIILDVNRYVLTFALLLVGFALFVWLEHVRIIDAADDTTPLLYLFSALAGGNITLITIVISINQLILSRELRSPRELQTEMNAAAEYREAVEAETERLVVPEQPEDFLKLLAKDTYDQVTKIDTISGELDNSYFEDDLEEFTVVLESELEDIIRRLEQSHGGVFPALSTVLDADFATRINHIRWLQKAYADSDAEFLWEPLDDLEQHLEQLDVARQYFKTIYIKQELSDVSKLVMSSGLVAVVVAMLALVFTGYLTASLPYWEHLFLIPLAVAINLTPLALLISHVFRIATVARRTAAITPFLAPTD